jgi:general secretion pathway protein D
MRAYDVSSAMAKEIMQDAGSDTAVLDVSDFFMGIPFPEGTSAFYRPDFNRLVVHQTPAGLQAIDQLMGRLSEEPDYKQIEIETKFIEVEQNSLNELGFDWDFSDQWQVAGDTTIDLVNQTLSDTLRTAAAIYGAGSPGALTLTKDGWLPLELTIRALEQSDGADVLSAPSVTTTDGSTAQIWVGDRELMPTAFSPQSEGTSVAVAYNGWKERNIGVHLEVTPTVAENGLINLSLKPEVIDLVGSDIYSITPNNASMLIWSGADTMENAQQGRFPIPNVPGLDTAWNIMRATLGGTDPNDHESTTHYEISTTGEPNNAFNVQETTPSDGYWDQRRSINHDEYGIAVPQLTGALPVFRVRRIDTNITVADGSTVGMGGLIYEKLETYKDKVPVLGSIPLLGRMFRSEGERSVKRNLMIFVTATQVDVNGRRVSDLSAQ